MPLDLAAETGHGLGQLLAPRWRLAEPKRNRRRLALRILYAHDAALHANDAIGSIAKLEDVALEALHGEILVDRADHEALRLEQHLEVGIIRNGAAGGDGREPRSAPSAQHAVN